MTLAQRRRLAAARATWADVAQLRNVGAAMLFQPVVEPSHTEDPTRGPHHAPVFALQDRSAQRDAPVLDQDLDDGDVARHPPQRGAHPLLDHFVRDGVRSQPRAQARPRPARAVEEAAPGSSDPSRAGPTEVPRLRAGQRPPAPPQPPITKKRRQECDQGTESQTAKEQALPCRHRRLHTPAHQPPHRVLHLKTYVLPSERKRRTMAEVPIWIVGADHWPRALLRAELIERGYDATGFVTLEEAVRRLMLPPARRPALLVLDRRDQVVDERTSALLSRARRPDPRRRRHRAPGRRDPRPCCGDPSPAGDDGQHRGCRRSA